MEINFKPNENNFQILDVCQKNDNDVSKASADITKESLTDARLQQVMSDDNHKGVPNIIDGDSNKDLANISN